MRKTVQIALVTLGLIATSLVLWGQSGTISGQVVQPSFAASNATIRVCPSTATGTPCSPLSTIYLDSGLTVPASNPYTSDQYGNYSVFAAAGYYLVQVTTNGVTYAYSMNVPVNSSLSLFSAGDLSPLFTTHVANPGTTPDLTFTLLTAGPNTVFANCTSSTAAPTYCSVTTGMLPFTYSGNTTELATVSGALTSGHLIKADASGNLADDGLAITALSGNTTTVLTTTGSLTSGHLTKIDTSGNVIDDGLAITALSGNTTTVATTNGVLTAGNLTKSDANGNIVDAGVAITGTLTNGNLIKISGTALVDAGLAITALSGNTTTVATTSGSLTSGHCVSIDANGNLVDSGSNTCGGSVFPTPTRAGDVIYWNGSTWTTLAGNNSGTNYFSENGSGVPSWEPNEIPCESGWGDGLNAIAAGTYLQSFCYNTTTSTITLTGFWCNTDNSGTTTLNATNSGGTALLTGSITCSPSWTTGTQSGTTTLASGDYIKFTAVADGTSKQINFAVRESQ